MMCGWFTTLISLDTKIWLGEALSPIALRRALFLLFPALPCWSALECWLASILWLLQPWVYWRATCGWLCAASCSLVCWTPILGLLCFARVLMQCWFVGLCFASWVARCYWVNAKDLFACWGFVPSAYTWGFILMVFGCVMFAPYCGVCSSITAMYIVVVSSLDCRVSPFEGFPCLLWGPICGLLMRGP
jgi:hypothetical protein